MSQHTDYICTDNDTGPVLCVPMHQDNGELAGVLELLRRASSPQFGPEDEEIVESYLSWAALAVQYGKTHVVIDSGEAQYLLNDTFIALSRYYTCTQFYCMSSLFPYLVMRFVGCFSMKQLTLRLF